MSELIPIDSPGWSLEYGEPGHPLVVVVHDWYGRLPWVGRYAESLSSFGFRVVVPDLYNGVATTDTAAASQLRAELDVALCLAIIDDAILEARLQGSERMGVVGFSVGGWLALLHAQGGSADAVVSYYGSLDSSEYGVTPCPLLLHLAEVDQWPAGGDPENLILHLKDHGTPVTRHTYSGTTHSFANESIDKAWDPAVAALSFERTVDFLGEHLR
ncbi:MAG: dienelactone hydrolase family protein [Homoserinimonas sp.]